MAFTALQSPADAQRSFIWFGPHGLRRALAGELLRRGAGLVAISQVLRHQDLATTALYAKVDLISLRQVDQPWPGAVR